MASSTVFEVPTGGFSFENVLRNELISNKGFPLPKARKTGTTIVGITYKDGVILGADTRATEGSIIADKNCCKIHYLAPNMRCGGAGTAADTEKVTDMIASQLALHRLATNRTVPVCTANRMIKQMLFRYQGHIGAALIVGGVDKFGPHIYNIYPHGSTDKLPYTSMGSGSLAAMAVFETYWKQDLSLEEGTKVVRDAIAAGIFNDLGSGSNIDICVINKDGAKLIRPYEEANAKGVRSGKYDFKRGSTAVLESKLLPMEVESTMIRKIEVAPEAMDVMA